MTATISSCEQLTGFPGMESRQRGCHAPKLSLGNPMAELNFSTRYLDLSFLWRTANSILIVSQ